jgi:Zn-dependent protease
MAEDTVEEGSPEAVHPLSDAMGVSGAFKWLLATMGIVAIALVFNPPPALAIPLLVVVVLEGWVATLCLHEFGHAAAAYAGGDRSLAEKGYLRLDPLRYTTPGRTLAWPLLFLLLSGVGLPWGPDYIDASAVRTREWRSLVGLAGPLVNVALLAPLLLLLFVFGWAAEPFLIAVSLLAFLQITTIILNLIPLPPFDAYAVISPWLPRGLRRIEYFGGVFMVIVCLALVEVGPARSLLIWNYAASVARSVHLSLDRVGQGVGHVQLPLFGS